MKILWEMPIPLLPSLHTRLMPPVSPSTSLQGGWQERGT